jgi:hypothetical protein
LDHNAKRLFKLIESDVIVEMNSLDITHASMIRRYCNNEQYAPNSRDSNLFVTAVSPLKLTSESLTSSWINITHQSVRFCRPKPIQLIKESAEHTLKVTRKLKLEIARLESLSIVFDNGNKCIDFQHDVRITSLDGKVLQNMYGNTAMSRCGICQASPN